MSTLASLKLYGSIPLEKFSRLPVLQKDLSGKHVLVSGGSAGLGAEAVRHFALQRRPPASITILCRNVKNGERVARDVTRAAAASGNGFVDGSIHVESVDLCDFASVRAFAERYNARGEALDVCLMNAGVIDLAYKTTRDGHESTLQTNVLSPFLLITLLRPSLERAHSARVAITSSGLAVCAQTSTDPIFADEKGDYIANGDRKETYNGPAAYNNSKLLEAILARQFAKHFSSKNVSFTSVDPGYCHSSLDREFPGVLYYIAVSLRYVLGRTTELGSRNLLFASLADASDGIRGNGEWISSCKTYPPHEVIGTPAGDRIEERIYKQTVRFLKEVAGKEATQGL